MERIKLKKSYNSSRKALDKYFGSHWDVLEFIELTETKLWNTTKEIHYDSYYYYFTSKRSFEKTAIYRLTIFSKKNSAYDEVYYFKTEQDLEKAVKKINKLYE